MLDTNQPYTRTLCFKKKKNIGAR